MYSHSLTYTNPHINTLTHLHTRTITHIYTFAQSHTQTHVYSTHSHTLSHKPTALSSAHARANTDINSHTNKHTFLLQRFRPKSFENTKVTVVHGRKDICVFKFVKSALVLLLMLMLLFMFMLLLLLLFYISRLSLLFSAFVFVANVLKQLWFKSICGLKLLKIYLNLNISNSQLIETESSILHRYHGHS